MILGDLYNLAACFSPINVDLPSNIREARFLGDLYIFHVACVVYVGFSDGINIILLLGDLCTPLVRLSQIIQFAINATHNK